MGVVQETFTPLYPEILRPYPELDQFLPHLPVIVHHGNATIPIGEYEDDFLRLGMLVSRSDLNPDSYKIDLESIGQPDEVPLPVSFNYGSRIDGGPIGGFLVDLTLPHMTAVKAFSASGEAIELGYGISYELFPHMNITVTSMNERMRYFSKVLAGEKRTPRLLSAGFMRRLELLGPSAIDQIEQRFVD